MFTRGPYTHQMLTLSESPFESGRIHPSHYDPTISRRISRIITHRPCICCLIWVDDVTLVLGRQTPSKSIHKAPIDEFLMNLRFSAFIVEIATNPHLLIMSIRLCRLCLGDESKCNSCCCDMTGLRARNAWNAVGNNPSYSKIPWRIHLNRWHNLQMRFARIVVTFRHGK